MRVKQRRSTWQAVLLLPLCLQAISCVSRAPGPPQQVFQRYLQALERDDARAAYLLLEEKTQEHLPYAAFLSEWQATSRERSRQAAVLKKTLATSPAPQQRAVLTLRDGVRVNLLQRQGRGDNGSRWYLTDLDLHSPRPETPTEALRLLLSAAEQHSFEAVMRLLSPSQRQAVELELRERIHLLRAALVRGQEPEIQGERARLQLDPRFHIDLRKEKEAWWISDLN